MSEVFHLSERRRVQGPNRRGDPVAGTRSQGSGTLLPGSRTLIGGSLGQGPEESIFQGSGDLGSGTLSQGSGTLAGGSLGQGPEIYIFRDPGIRVLPGGWGK